MDIALGNAVSVLLLSQLFWALAASPQRTAVLPAQKRTLYSG